MVVMGIFLLGAILWVGTLYWKLHSLPERMAHKSRKLQFELVAVLGLISLFTHNHIFWIAGLLLAMIDLPDFMPMYTRDLKQEADRLGVPEDAIPTMKDSLAHHPLNDAIHVKTIHDFLKAYEREKLGIL